MWRDCPDFRTQISGLTGHAAAVLLEAAPRGPGDHGDEQAPMNQQAPTDRQRMAHATRPLVLDVDGTFLRTDMLLESFLAALGRDPLATLGAVLRNMHSKARLKQALARLGPLRADLLPVNPDMAALARHGVQSGRQVVLASGSDESLVAALAEAHGIPEWIASDGDTNLTGARKAQALEQRFGRAGFD